MQYLEPQCVDTKDILKWFKQSLELISRRWLAYISSVSVFFLIVYFAAQSIVSLGELGSPIALVSILVIFSAFIFFFILSNLVLLAYWSDHSQGFSLNSLFNSFLPSQKVFFKMAIVAVSSGFFFWYVSILLHPEKNLLSSSLDILQMLDNNHSSIQFVFSEGAVFLYFSLIVMFIFRTLFSVPLILFHHLNYQDAQHLSQKALMKNVKVVSHILLIWVCLFLAAIKIAPVLAALLLPIFGTFLYVSFRHIFWKQGCNERQKEVIHNIVTSKAV